MIKVKIDKNKKENLILNYILRRLNEKEERLLKRALMEGRR